MRGGFAALFLLTLKQCLIISFSVNDPVDLHCVIHDLIKDQVLLHRKHPTTVDGEGQIAGAGRFIRSR